MLWQGIEGRAGWDLPDRIALRRVIDMPADLAFQPGIGGQALGVAQVGTFKGTHAKARVTCFGP
jgi:hypothetical protein